MGAWIEILNVPPIRTLELSLPVWERGLKFRTIRTAGKREPSLPVWERGLKFEETVALTELILSLPVWERGLKLLNNVEQSVTITGRSPCGSVD